LAFGNQSRTLLEGQEREHRLRAMIVSISRLRARHGGSSPQRAARFSPASFLEDLAVC
jgi:hypothetical protein